MRGTLGRQSVQLPVSVRLCLPLCCTCAHLRNDNNGDTARRGLGETDRERVLTVRWENTVLGKTDGTTCWGTVGGTSMLTSCTVTNGGAPVPWTDDAVSSYSSQGVDGEVTALDSFLDGEDISDLHLGNN